MFYSNVYGITCVSTQDTWEAARGEYLSSIKRDLASPVQDRDREFLTLRKTCFEAEMEMMGRIETMSSLLVAEVHFACDGDSKKLTVAFNAELPEDSPGCLERNFSAPLTWGEDHGPGNLNRSRSDSR
jgi:hypothetical protein